MFYTALTLNSPISGKSQHVPLRALFNFLPDVTRERNATSNAIMKTHSLLYNEYWGPSHGDKETGGGGPEAYH